MYYPLQDGPFKTTQTVTLFSTSIYDAYKTYNETLRTNFNTSTTAYEALRVAYNAKADLERTRLEDPLR